jgi:hypothetical protein
LLRTIRTSFESTKLSVMRWFFVSSPDASSGAINTVLSNLKTAMAGCSTGSTSASI